MHIFCWVAFLQSLLPSCSAARFESRAVQANCDTCQPNPIATLYPNEPTGTINGTISVWLVPIAYARSLLPPRFTNSILTASYSRFGIPSTMYPILIESTIDHDIRFANANVVADFSSFHLNFPFIDLLGDGYSNFQYEGFIYLPPTVPIATEGAAAYGQTVLPATFDPADAPYKAVKGRGKYISFQVYPGLSQTVGKPPAAGVWNLEKKEIGPYPLAFYKNVTNQPIFFNNSGTICDNMIRFWNTSLSMGRNVPRGIIGDALVNPPLLPKKHYLQGLRGIRGDTAFLERNYVPCKNLKGYKGTGDGDSG